MTALERAREWMADRGDLLVVNCDDETLADEFEAHAKEAVREVLERASRVVCPMGDHAGRADELASCICSRIRTMVPK